MVWDGISMPGRTNLVTVPSPGITVVHYVEDILRLQVIPMRRWMRHNFILIQDNARPHTARIVLNILKEHNIEVLPHLLVSSDLNSIEHLWNIMGRRIRELERPLTNLQQLEAALHQIWHEIPQTAIRACINICERLQEIIRRRGGDT